MKTGKSPRRGGRIRVSLLVVNVVLLLVLAGGSAALLTLFPAQLKGGEATEGDESLPYGATLPPGNVLIAEYTATASTVNENRDQNIAYAASLLNHTSVAANETVSLEQVLGDTTNASNYLPAPAIVDGSTFENEIGGGICQVATTLYYVGLKANMTVVERHPHSIPPTYVPLGFDATLNYGTMDLKLRNDSGHTLYFEALADGESITVRCYGQPLPNDERVELVSRTARIIEPNDPEYILSSDLPVGEERVQIEAREGYEVYTGRIYYRGDAKTQEMKISQDVYDAVDAVIIRGTAPNGKS